MRKNRYYFKSFIHFCLILLACSCVTTTYAQATSMKPILKVVGEKGKKPIIGVSAGVNDAVSGVTITYINSVRRAGGVPLIIPFTSCEEEIAEVLDAIDGLVMTGGEDISPSYYGEEPIRALGKIAPARDVFDYKLIRMAVAKGIPVLGICRGEQMMNVAFGGTLYQDIPSQNKDSYIKHNQEGPRTYGSHSIKIEKESKLYTQIGNESVYVNSYHHQAVKELAPGFKVTALSADGIIEAIEMIDNDKVWGVQFHPEGFVDGGDTLFLGIFQYLVEKANPLN